MSRTDPTEWTVPRLEFAIQDVAADLRRAADSVEAAARFNRRSDTPYFAAATSVQSEIRSLVGNLDIDRVYRAAFDAETITVESLERAEAERLRIEAAKTEQWFDGEEWYPVYLYNTADSTRAHYFVRGAGDGDGAICGRATYSSGIRNSPIKPTCKKCDEAKSRR
jgi:hypothetical protein